MIRFALVAALLLAPAAFATGERISITGSAAPLKETLCISMTCVGGGVKDFVVSGRPVKGGIEITVTSTSGQSRLVHFAPLREGKVSSTDLVRATSLVFQAIEKGPVNAPQKPRAAFASKRLKGKLIARR